MVSALILLLFCVRLTFGQSNDIISDCNGNNEYFCETDTCNACIECNPVYFTNANCDKCICQMYWWTILIVKYYPLYRNK